MKPIKITVFGDIMVEAPFFKQAKKEAGFDFDTPFSHLSHLLADSDAVIGNLETPLGGECKGYVEDCFSFNSPDVLAASLQKLGFVYFSTANNHCLDRGMEGLCRTLDVLDSLGIGHTGTYRNPTWEPKAGCLSVGGLKIAIVAYTYGTNFTNNGVWLGDKERCVDLLMPQGAPSRIRTPPPHEGQADFGAAVSFVERIAGRPLSMEEKQTYKRIMHLSTVTVDDVVRSDVLDPYLARMEADIQEAKQKADLVLALLHTGGQFNTSPGSYSLYVVEKAVHAGADAVLCAHSHTIQPGVMRSDTPCFYSLGNVSMYPVGDYLDMNCLPEYGMAVHLYLTDKKIQKVTFSLFKMYLENGDMAVVPVDVLLERMKDRREREELIRDVNGLCRRITGKTFPTVDREFEFFKEKE